MTNLLYALLVAGTCIGGGMLALPSAASEIGFFPSILVAFCAYLFMTATGLLYAQLCQYNRNAASLLQITNNILGTKARMLFSIIFVGIGYASLIAYLVETSKICESLLPQDEKLFSQNPWLLYSILLFALCSSLLFLSAKVMEKLNGILVAALFVSFLVLISVLSRYAYLPNLLHQNWEILKMLKIFPLFLTTFSFPGIVPLIFAGTKRDQKATKKAIILGTTITLFIYLLWLFTVMSAVPCIGENSLYSAFLAKRSAAPTLLELCDSNRYFETAVLVFTFLALITSFIGISWGLFEYISANEGLKKTTKERLSKISIIAFPTLVFALAFPQIFFFALEASGGLGDGTVNGIFPALMIISSNKRLKKTISFKDNVYLRLILISAIAVVFGEIIGISISFWK